ncbi:hypothetical protein PIB30_044387 [Stylosanthes scabra]|uniref:Uncharacterized protein n=1 Tax=Stylosanthes scabra TaxID=79078 RepID=A0ABU6WFR0_9FABA|nr:hypothetical protein [Stylosanthes scabra]
MRYTNTGFGPSRPNIRNSCPELGRTECSDLLSCRIVPSRGVRADLKSYLRHLSEGFTLSSSGGRSSFVPSGVDSCPELGVHEILYFRSEEKASSRFVSKSADILEDFGD